MTETLTIGQLGHAGDGIATGLDGPVYVPLTLPGEVVEVEREGTRARLISVVTPSSDRKTPVCRHFGACGTCALEHMEKAAYLAWKREQVVQAFTQRGIPADVEAVVEVAAGSRRRAIFSVIQGVNGPVVGFHRRHAEEIVAIEECPVLAPAIVAKLAVFREIARISLPQGKPGRMVVVATDNGLDVAVGGGRRGDRQMMDALGRLAGEPAMARLSVDGALAFMNRRPELRAGGVSLFPTPGGFIQASASAEAAMAEVVVGHVGKGGPVADLFSGIGTFTLRLAARAPVTAVEGEQGLLDALGEAVRKASGIRPVTTRKRDLFRNPLVPVELNAFGAVVFDPPAAGAKAQAEQIAASKVKKVVAVSCNPATLARDARVLIDGGYRLVRVVPVDQFLWSAEIEAVATFER